MRIALAVVLLAGCASPALMQMQAACNSGDMRACDAVLAHERAVTEAFLYAPPAVTPTPAFPMMQPTPIPAMQQRSTWCTPDYSGGFFCNAF